MEPQWRLQISGETIGRKLDDGISVIGTYGIRANIAYKDGIYAVHRRAREGDAKRVVGFIRSTPDKRAFEGQIRHGMSCGKPAVGKDIAGTMTNMQVRVFHNSNIYVTLKTKTRGLVK